MSAAPSVILLVEDEQNDVFLIQRAFRKAGLDASLQVAGDGEQAMAYLAGQGEFADRVRHPFPQLVLLDLKLPRKSGLETLAWIRGQQEMVKRVPVVALTSSKQSADVNRAYELGANSYLVKPVGFDGLLAMVQALASYWLLLNEKPDAP